MADHHSPRNSASQYKDTQNIRKATHAYRYTMQRPIATSCKKGFAMVMVDACWNVCQNACAVS